MRSEVNRDWKSESGQDRTDRNIPCEIDSSDPQNQSCENPGGGERKKDPSAGRNPLPPSEIDPEGENVSEDDSRSKSEGPAKGDPWDN
jgi:hypothetical protein